MTHSRRQGRSLEDSHDHQQLDRLTFFSDAVFAIAMTLLVIDLRLPDLAGVVTSERLTDALVELAPRLFAYALSFAVVGSYWLTHWRRYAFIRRADERLALLNLLLLGIVALIPFPTALIGEHGDLAIVAAIYAVVLAAGGLAGTASWLYAARAGLLAEGVTPAEVRTGEWRGLSVPLVFLGSLAIIPILGPGPAELSWLLIIPLHRVIARVARAAN